MSIYENCSGLTEIVVASGNSVYDSRNNCNAIIRTSDNSLILGCKNTVIPASVTSIGASAFDGCSGLTSINIPASVTSIGGSAFYCCDSLANIYCYGSTPAEPDNHYLIFSEDTYSGCTLHVPYGTIDIYKTADGWKFFANIVEFDPTGVEAVSADRKPATERRIYNLGRVRMAAPQRGLNIINGKKVMY